MSSRRGGKNRAAQKPQYNEFAIMKELTNNGSPELWQSSQLNNRLFMYYRNVIMQLAVSRFRWLNLPETCNERFLEWTLLHEGCASIAFPNNMKGTFYSLKAMQVGTYNKYGDPIGWKTLGLDGTTFYANWNSGAFIWENMNRFPLMMGINLYANELVHIRITKRVNRNHQKIPFILTGPQQYKNVMTNLYKQIDGGEPAVIATDGLNAVEVNALQTGVDFLGEELAQDETNVWDRIYTMLGIENSPFKLERQTEDEIRAQKMPTSLIAMNSLYERRKAADFLNEHFGEYLKAPIQVVWRQDNESENFNFEHNIQTQVREVF